MSHGDGHGERLSAVDASFLRLETPEAHMHIGASALFSVAPGAQRPTVHALRARVAARLHVLPRCRQRLQGAPLGLGQPRWVDDPRFDVGEHVMALTGPGEAVTLQSFGALRDAMLSEPLPRDRPLWHILLVPLLQDGRVGIVARVHHAMADGIAALGLTMLLLDADADADADGDTGLSRLRAWSAQPAPGAARWALDPLADGAGRLGQTARAAVAASRRPRQSAGETLVGGRRFALAVRDDMLPRAPRSSLNVAVGPRRTLVGFRAPSDELRSGRDGTLNDVGLAVVAGALRALALGRGESAHALKAMVPFSVRRGAEHDELGNHLSLAAIWLPLHLRSAAKRLDCVREQTECLKRTRRQHGSRALLAGIGLLPGPPRNAVFSAAAAPRAFNLLVSSIPGPRGALSMLGARLQEIYPVVPVGHRHALAIGMLSYDRHLHFGLHADPDAIPEITQLPALLTAEIGALSDPGRRDGATVTSLFTRARSTPPANRSARAGPPWAGYDEQNAAHIRSQLRTDKHELAGLVADYEAANKHRRGVLQAAQRERDSATREPSMSAPRS